MVVGLLEAVLVTTGGALGGMGRLAVGEAVTRWIGGAFPWGTLVVNLGGALAMGMLLGGLGASEAGRDTLAWSLLATGLLGGYTTVSSLSLQSLLLWQQGHGFVALANGLATLLAGLAAVGIGIWLTGPLS